MHSGSNTLLTFHISLTVEFSEVVYVKLISKFGRSKLGWLENKLLEPKQMYWCMLPMQSYVRIKICIFHGLLYSRLYNICYSKWEMATSYDEKPNVIMSNKILCMHEDFL